MARNRTAVPDGFDEDLARSARKVAEDLDAYAAPRRKDKKETINNHIVHDYRDGASRYQFTRGLKPWAKRSLGVGA